MASISTSNKNPFGRLEISGIKRSFSLRARRLPPRSLLLEALGELLLLLLCAVYILLCRSAVPSSPFMAGDAQKDYCVFFANKDAGCQTQFLEDAGCEGVIAQSTLPFPMPQDVSSLLPYGIDTQAGIALIEEAASNKAAGSADGDRQQADSYLERRLKYFTDSSGKYSLYYVPAVFAAKLRKAVNKKAGAPSMAGAASPEGTDIGIASEVRRRGFAVVLILAIIFGIISKNVLCSALASVLPVLSSLSNPNAFSAISSAAALCALFSLRPLWPISDADNAFRRHYVRALLQKGIFPVFLIISIASGIISGGIVMSILVLLGSFAALRACRIARMQTKQCRLVGGTLAAPSARLFCSVPILQANAKWQARDAISSALTMLVCIVLPFMGNSAASGIKIAADIPSLDDYCQWCFNCITYPYRSLICDALDNGADENTVMFLTYKKDRGVIREEKIQMRLDDDFNERCIQSIDELPETAVEHLMKNREAKMKKASAAPKTITAKRGRSPSRQSRIEG